MISFDEAVRLVLQQAKNWGDEIIPVQHSLGRVLAESLPADRDYPPFNRSAMDGYAIRFDDHESGTKEYRVIETIFPAQQPTKIAGRGDCYKIMTGAAVPASVDTVIRVEDSELKDDTVRFTTLHITKGQNIARRGEDVSAGSPVLAFPCPITAPVMALFTAIGREQVRVRRRPCVSVFTTGNEVVDPGLPVNEVQIRNSNQTQLLALLQSMQIAAFTIKHLPDDHSIIRNALTNDDSDLLITCGAVSAGDADFVPAVLEQIGVKKLFHKVAIRPGKPIWVGSRGDGKMVFSLPGNPMSCLAGFLLFIRPYIDACYGLEICRNFKLPLVHSWKKSTPLDEFFPVRRVAGGIERIAFNGSGDIRAAVLADGLARHPAETQVIEAGTLVSYYPF